MSLAGTLYTVGASSAETIVQPSTDAQEVIIRNLMPDGDLNQHSREGYAFNAHADFSIVQGTATSFSFLTGAFGAQILGYAIASSASSLHAELIEDPTVVTDATYPAYNLNRSSANTHDSVLKLATSVTGGTEITSESIFSSNQTSSGASSTKRITLAPNTQYAMKFNNTGAQTTSVHFELIWTERYNGYTTVWLNGEVGTGYPLQGGHEIKLTMIQGQALTAQSGGADCQIAVLRQD